MNARTRPTAPHPRARGDVKVVKTDRSRKTPKLKDSHTRPALGHAQEIRKYALESNPNVKVIKTVRPRKNPKHEISYSPGAQENQTRPTAARPRKG